MISRQRAVFPGLVIGVFGFALTPGSADVRMDYLPAGPERPSGAALEAFWAAASAANPGIGDDYEVRWFGIDAKTTRGIFDYIQSGAKTGTYTLPWLLEKTGQPRARDGDYVVLIDYDGTPTLLLRMVSQETVAFGAIDARITGLDGPSVRDVEVWKPLHQKFWDGELAAYGLSVTPDMPVLVERFALVYARDRSGPASGP